MRNDDQSYSIGISGVYDGFIVPELWTRIVFTVAAQNSAESRLAKFVNGLLVGEQTVPVDRFTIDPQNQLWLFTDNNRELFEGRVGAFALNYEAVSDETVLELGSASPGGIFEQQDTVVEFDFTRENALINGAIPAVVSDARLVDREFRDAYDVDSGASFENWGPGGGFLLVVDLPDQLSEYTLIYDLLLSSDQTGSFGSLWQTDGVSRIIEGYSNSHYVEAEPW